MALWTQHWCSLGLEVLENVLGGVLHREVAKIADAPAQTNELLPSEGTKQGSVTNDVLT